MVASKMKELQSWPESLALWEVQFGHLVLPVPDVPESQRLPGVRRRNGG